VNEISKRKEIDTPIENKSKMNLLTSFAFSAKKEVNLLTLSLGSW